MSQRTAFPPQPLYYNQSSKEPLKLRILLIGGTPPPFHGSSIYFSSILAKLSNEPDLEVCHVETSDKKDDLDNLGRMGLLNIAVALRALWNVIAACVRFRPQLVYIPISQNTLAYFRDGLFIIAGKLSGARVMVHLHGSYFGEFYRGAGLPVRWFVDATIRLADAAVVLGEKLKPIFQPWLDDSKIFVLPNFTERSAADTPRRVAGGMGGVTLAYLGNIIASKGIFELLAAMAILGKESPNTYLLKVAGKFGNDPLAGVTRNDCENRFNEMSAATHGIEYIGFLKGSGAKEKLFNETDILVFPSWYAYEGQPIVLLEAMAAGVPIISSKNTGVIDETVVDGETGILVDPKDPKAIAAAVRLLGEDASLRREMSRKAVARFEKKYTIDVHMKELKSIVRAAMTYR